MSLYQIESADSEKELGRYPQVQIWAEKITPESPNFIYNANHDEVLAQNIKIPSMKLEYRAKKTDFIWAVIISYGLIVSKKVKDILETFYIPDLRIIPFSLVDSKSIEYKYYYIHVPKKDDYINAKESSFIASYYSHIDAIKRLHSVESFTDLEKLSLKRGEKCYVDHLVLKDNIQIPDLFITKTGVLTRYGKLIFHLGNIHISERLKNSLENEYCTGVSYQRVPNKPLEIQGRNIK